MNNNFLTRARDCCLMDCKRSYQYMAFLFSSCFLTHMFLLDKVFFDALMSATTTCVMLWLISFYLNKKWPKKTKN